MLRLVDVCSLVFFSPAAGLRSVRKLSGRTALCFFFSWSLLVYWPTALLAYPRLAGERLFLFFLINFCLLSGLFFLFSCLLTGLAEFFTPEKIRAKDVFTGLVFALLPFSLFPLALFAPPVISGRAAPVFLWLSLWCFCLFVTAVRQLFSCSISRALWLVFLPCFLLSGGALLAAACPILAILLQSA
jgi:hypothetical protein